LDAAVGGMVTFPDVRGRAIEKPPARFLAPGIAAAATPTFFLGRRGETPRKLGLAAVDAGSFTDSLDRLIGRMVER
jgi:hypothetical protein